MRLLIPLLLLLLAVTDHSAVAASVSGRVLDHATQQPIASAAVSIYNRGAMGIPSHIATATTAADGRYSVAFQYDGAVAGIARATGYAARTHEGLPCGSRLSCAERGNFFPLAGGSATADFALGRAATISGLVRDEATGEPIGTSYLALRNTTTDYLVSLMYSDTAGRFQVDGLHPGSYTLEIPYAPAGKEPFSWLRYLRYYWPQLHCDDVQVRCDSVVPGQINVTEGQSVDLDVPLRRGSYLRTRVVSEGNGLPTVVHYAIADSIAQPHHGVTGTDGYGDGYMLVGPLLPGPLHLVLESAFPASYDSLIYPDRPCASTGCDFSGAPVVQVPTTDAIHTLPDAHVQPLRTIRGRVTSSVDGRPIAGLRVDAGNLRAPQGGTWGFRPTASAWTNANGEYALEGFGEAEVMVRTRQNGLGWLDQAWQNEDCDAVNLFCQRDTQHASLAFDLQQHPAGIDFVLGRGASLRGRVVEETTSRPLANYAVAVVPLAVLRIGKPVLTDADGNFRIDGLTADSYYLFASAEPVYGNTAGVIHPGGPCSFAVLNNGLNSCFPTTQQPLTPPAGGVLDGLTIVMPRPNAIFRDRFEQ